MIKQLIINGKKSYDDFDLYISERTISQPKKKSIKESVPFSNVVYDFSDINGEIYWEERTLKYVFDFAELSTEEMEKAKSKVLTWLMNVHDTDIYDPYIGDYHFRGSFESDSWSEDFGAGALTINFSVYPYKISNSDTSIIEEIGDELTGSSPLTIDNSASDDIESLTIYGNSEQETRSGKNLYILPNNATLNGITYTKNNNGTINLSGTASAKTSIIKDTELSISKLTDGSTYTLSINKTIPSGIYFMIEVYNGSTWLRGYNVINDTNPKTFDIDLTNATKIRSTIQINQGITTNISNIGVQLEEDSTATEFEQYGVSPSSEFPSEVKTIKGVKNYFDGEIETGGYNDSTGAKQTNSNLVRNKKPIYVEPNKTYIISNNGISIAMNIYEYDKDGNYIGYLTGNAIPKGTPFTTSNNTAYINISRSNSYYDKIQIEEGSIIHEYVPYGTWLRVDTKSPNLYDFKDKKEQSSGVSVDEDGWITCTYDNSVGSKSKYLNYYTNNLDLKTNTDYIVVAEIKEVTGQGNLYPFSNHSNGGQFSTSANLDISKLSNGLIRICKGKTRSSFSGIDYGIRSFVEFPSGKSGSITFRLSVLEDITITADNFKYSSYGKDYILIDMKKPNLFDKDKTPDNYFYNSSGATQTSNDNFINQKIIPTSRTYAISYKNRYATLNGTDIQSYVRFVEFDSNGTFIKRTLLYTNNSTITLDGNTSYFILCVDVGPNAYFEELKIYEGTNASDYYELCKIGDTKDEMFLDKSTNKITQRIGKVVLDGSESDVWSVNKMTYGYAFDITNSLSAIGDNSKKTLLSNKFKASTFNDRNNGDVNIIYSYSGDSRIRILTDVATNIDEWKTWLSENPVEVYYTLATPVEINNEPIILPKTFDDGTIITINDELEVDIDVTYNEKKTLIIDNISSHRVTPTIMVGGDLTIEHNDSSYALTTGTYNNGLYLESGINEVILRGTGKIKFSYVEEVL